VALYDDRDAEIDRVTFGANVVGYTPDSRNPALVGLSASRFGHIWITALASKSATNTPPEWLK